MDASLKCVYFSVYVAEEESHQEIPEYMYLSWNMPENLEQYDLQIKHKVRWNYG